MPTRSLPMLLAATVAIATACGGAKPTPQPKPKPSPPAQPTATSTTTTAPTPTKTLTSGLDRSNFDPKVRPQDDLYRSINGGWLKRVQIPADKSNYGAFSELADAAEKQLRAIVEEAAANKSATPGSETRKVGDFYAAWLDEARLEKLGISPLTATFAQIDALKSKADLPKLMASLGRNGVRMPLMPYVLQDDKKSTEMIGVYEQSGLGLPNRDFYLQKDKKFSALRAAYQAHIAKMWTLSGGKDAKSVAAGIMKLETQLATAQWDKVRNRDPNATYNKVQTAALPKFAPGFDLGTYNKAVGFGAIGAVIVRQPSYVKALGTITKKTSLRQWKRYLRWHVLSSAASLLSKAFVDEDFAFFQHTLDGIPSQRPRWKRAIGAINRALGEAVGKIYVARHFPPENKARMDKLVANLIRAFRAEFDTLDWMGPQTRKAAKAKLGTFSVKIGYPNRWRDYTALKIDRTDLVGNIARSAAFRYDLRIAKLGKPVDREEWYMTPQTVNAYYDPQKNEIVFPAAILQPPFFNAAADDAVNYGGIGAVIGHEISHGFDDQGSQYDGAGNLRKWWSKDDRKRFDARAGALAAQYGAYEPIKGYKLNGKFTLGENIADLGGLKMAHKAWKMSLNGKPSPVLDGFTGAQRLFAGWAQAWRRKYREKNLLKRIKIDPHSPSEFRANGTPINIPAFHSAFGTKAGDKMYKAPANQVVIW
ncbi:MAG: peptidase M13 [Myxococcales bacterium]|nr:peptidase M13 [Myxococcales bacterium]